MIILHSTAVLGPFRDRCVRIIYGQTKSESGKFSSDLHWEKQNILKLEGLLLKSFVLRAYLINDLFKKC